MFLEGINTHTVSQVFEEHRSPSQNMTHSKILAAGYSHGYGLLVYLAVRVKDMSN